MPLVLLPAAVLLGCGTGCRRAAGGAPSAAVPPVRFVDVTRQAGVRFRHTNGARGRHYFAESMGAGCAFLEFGTWR